MSGKLCMCAYVLYKYIYSKDYTVSISILSTDSLPKITLYAIRTAQTVVIISIHPAPGRIPARMKPVYKYHAPKKGRTERCRVPK
jgi:hypothetical protein